MTTEAVTAFAERLKSDEALRAKLAGAADRAERLALVRAEGFEVSAGDVGAVKQALGIEELSDEDLEKLAGGVGSTTVATVVITVVSVPVAAGAAAFI
jgi:predicted ribosomally synthesized peptide with nif11-like leader